MGLTRPMEVFILTEDDHPVYTSYSYKDCIDYLLDLYYTKDEKPEYDYYAMTPVYSGNMTITHLGFIGDCMYEVCYFHTADRFPKLYTKYSAFSDRDPTYLFIDDNTYMDITSIYSPGNVIHSSEKIDVSKFQRNSGFESKDAAINLIKVFDCYQGNRNDFTKEQRDFIKRLKTEFRHLGE